MSIKVVLINIILVTKVIENATIQEDTFDLVFVVCKYSAMNKKHQGIKFIRIHVFIIMFDRFHPCNKSYINYSAKMSKCMLFVFLFK